MDGPCAVDQVGELSLAAGLRSVRTQLLVRAENVRQVLGGDESVEELPQRHAGVVRLDDVGRLRQDGLPS